MRQACVDAFPDLNHHLRQHVSQEDSYSNRVTAAVALANAGCTINEIAYQLRCKPESVEHYLRCCYKQIGALTEAAIRGSLLI
jgi:DNA-binding NarL/FixJ family response regulator